jgi:RsiW-degrading membrane proteinase PrsW (M82 family)
VGVVVIIALAFSILVALFWLSRFRRMDKYEKEPDRLIFLAFFAGALATVPAVILEGLFPPGSNRQSPLLGAVLLSYLWVAIVEEFLKFFAVRFTVYRSKQFNEVMDGMIYMISSALGFAATENVGYMLGFGFSTGILRAILSYLGHISFSAILGYYMGKAKIEGRKNWLWVGFFFAISLHWLYDFFIVFGAIKTSGGLLVLGLLIWSFGLVLTIKLMKKAQAVSPFRSAQVLPVRMTQPCQVCGKTVSRKALICHHCGQSLTPDHGE